MLGPVLGLILRITRRLPLHAGAVAIEGNALALLGPSGSGKSTLIASLLEHGCSLMADDLILVEEEDGLPVLRSGQANLRLWPSSLEALDLTASEFPRVFPNSSKRTVVCIRLFAVRRGTTSGYLSSCTQTGSPARNRSASIARKVDSL